MKKMSKVVLVCLIAVLVGGVFAGQGLCEKTKYAGITIRMLGPRHNWAIPMAETCEKLAEEMGMKFDVTWIEWDDALKKVILDLKSGSTTWDILVTLRMSMGQYIEIGALTPLDPLIQDIGDPETLGLDDFLESALEQASYEGKLYMLPNCTGTALLGYRKDLFESPIERKAFRERYGYELQPPETYRRFYDVAEFFTRKTGQTLMGEVLGADFYGTTHSNKLGFFMWHDFVTYLDGWNATSYDPATMMPTLNTPDFIGAVKFYTSLVPFLPPEHINMSSGESSALAAAGHAAMAIEFDDMFAYIHMDPDKSQTADKWALKQPPFGRAHNCLNGFGIYALSEHKEAAYKLLEKFFDSTVQKELALQYKQYLPPKKSVLLSPEIRAFHPEAEVKLKNLSRPCISNHPLLAAYPSMIDIITGYIQQVMLGKISPEEACDKAQEETVQLFREYGYIK